MEGASGYQLYRKAPGESDLTAYVVLGLLLEYLDEPDLEGGYAYTVSSIRQVNGQEALSGMSQTIEVSSEKEKGSSFSFRLPHRNITED